MLNVDRTPDSHRPLTLSRTESQSETRDVTRAVTGERSRPADRASTLEGRARGRSGQRRGVRSRSALASGHASGRRRVPLLCPVLQFCRSQRPCRFAIGIANAVRCRGAASTPCHHSRAALNCAYEAHSPVRSTPFRPHVVGFRDPRALKPLPSLLSPASSTLARSRRRWAPAVVGCSFPTRRALQST